MMDEFWQGDMFERLAHEAEVDPRAAGWEYKRDWFYVLMAILAWGLFWEFAERENENAQALVLVWAVVLVAVWVSENF